MTGTDYTAHLLILLIDGNDTVNAKFLYQRVPEGIRESSQSFNAVWNAVKALARSEFGDAIAILKQPFAPDAGATSVFKDVVDRLRDILVWHLTEHTVPELIADAYSNIELARCRQMLGNPAQVSRGLLARDQADAQGFVEVNARQAQHEAFTLDKTRVANLTTVVQFLERQQYDVSEYAEQLLAKETEQTEMKIQGKIAK